MSNKIISQIAYNVNNKSELFSDIIGVVFVALATPVDGVALDVRERVAEPLLAASRAFDEILLGQLTLLRGDGVLVQVIAHHVQLPNLGLV
jgi:hypothetical protein